METNKISIRELNKSEVLAQLPLLKLLTPSLNEERLSTLLDRMYQGTYHVIGAFLEKDCVGLSGYWVQAKLYCGVYLEADNVVVAPDCRSMGIGQLLLDKLEQIAKEEKCEVIMLDAYKENTKAHQFYERNGFAAKGFHFIKKLR